MMKWQKCKKGFTMVELSLALVFISVLLLSIGILTIHITSTYEKGLAMKAVNSVGKELIDDFTRAINTSPGRTVSSLCSMYKNDTEYNKCVNDKARKFMYQQRYNVVEIKGENHTVPTNGVFCTGRYSYIWNTAYAIDEDDYKHVVPSGEYRGLFRIKGVDISNSYRLLKITDFERKLCTQHLNANKYVYDSYTSYELSDAPSVQEELLENSENNLALYDLTFFAPTIHPITNSAFYSGTFILATLRGGVDINSYGDFCSDPPDNLDTDFAYCAVNKFNFAMRAAGEKLDSERW